MGTLKGMQDNWHHYGLQEPLEMRIGIATGFCTVGNFGSDLRLEYTAVGSGVNTASRLETAADNGDILMSFDTYSLVSDRIPCQELDTIHLKGIGPVRTFRPVTDDETGLSRLSVELAPLPRTPTSVNSVAKNLRLLGHRWRKRSRKCKRT